MKMLVFAFASLLSVGAFAQTVVSLGSKDRALSLVQSAKVVGVKNVAPSCPRGAACFPSRELQVLVTFSGCLDRLGAATANVTYNERTTKYDIVLTAVQIHNADSMRAVCAKAASKTLSIVVPGGVDKENANIILASSVFEEEVVAPAPVRCTREFRPVCGIKPNVCPPGRVCAAVMPAPKTYGNACLMRADGATLVKDGPCSNEE